MKVIFANEKTRSLFSGKKTKNLEVEAQSLLSCVSFSLEASQKAEDVINTPFLLMRMQDEEWHIGALDRHSICLQARFVENDSETFVLLEVKEHVKE